MRRILAGVVSLIFALTFAAAAFAAEKMFNVPQAAPASRDWGMKADQPKFKGDKSVTTSTGTGTGQGTEEKKDEDEYFGRKVEPKESTPKK